MITLLTDFGTADYFVPALKGAILTIYPLAQIIDLTHDVPPQDVAYAAFTLGACFRDFPLGTIHLAVVDPGVGSTRRPIVIVADGYRFIGPDNGIFSYVYASTTNARVFHATSEDIFRTQMSATFHGRDLFAPLAAQLDRGLDPEGVGPQLHDYKKLLISQPIRDPQTNFITGEIIHLDHFGNCITNLTAHELDPAQIPHSARISIEDVAIARFGTHFAEAENMGELLAYLGSAGYWEIGLWCDSAAARLKARRGMKIVLTC